MKFDSPDTFRGCGGLQWMNVNVAKENPRLLCSDLELGSQDDPDIVAWSLDHHVFRIPVYQGPGGGGAIYESHKPMLDKYWEFCPPADNSLPTSTREGMIPELPGQSSAKLKKPSWSRVHKDYCKLGPLEFDCPITYQTTLSGNIVRAIEADHRRSSDASSQHSLHQVIADHLNRLYQVYLHLSDDDDEDDNDEDDEDDDNDDNDNDDNDNDNDDNDNDDDDDPAPTDTTASPRDKPSEDEVFQAYIEAARAFQRVDPRRLPTETVDRERVAKQRETPLHHYPVQFSVNDTMTVPIPVSSDEILGQIASTLRDVAFFETLDSQMQTPNGDIQLHLPLLLIKKQPRYSDKALDDRARVATRNEQRIAMASAAWFLAQLGVEDFPIFGLVTNRKKGYLSQAWFSKRDNCCYVADCNIKENAFDLGSGESGGDRYKAFLSKLKDHAKELERRFRDNRKQLFDRATSEEASTLRWSTRAQLAEYEAGRATMI